MTATAFEIEPTTDERIDAIDSRLEKMQKTIEECNARSADMLRLLLLMSEGR